MNPFISIPDALEELRQGRMIVLVDDENREQEGDLIIAADKITPQAINFMTQQARGIICLTLTKEIITRLRIPMMQEHNLLPNQAAFAASVEAATGVTTGASTFDRAHTIKVVINPTSTPQDISMPGHVFPLQARPGGVLERAGHTEASVDLARLAGLAPAAVICEIMKQDGSMARLPDLYEFSNQHNIKLVSINDLIEYRLKNEIIVEEIASAHLPLKIDNGFTIKIFREKFTGEEHIALVHGEISKKDSVLVRIHSECLTGDSFGSLRCDCGDQLQHSLKEVAKTGGIVLYMKQEGRGIGLSNKIKAYELQSQGLDTVQANHQLGFLADHRNYGLSAQILRYLGVKQIRLMTNNPDKVKEMKSLGLTVIERLPIEISATKENKNYLKTKRDKLGHWLTTLEE